MKEKTIYINMKDKNGKIETVDEFTSTQHDNLEAFEVYVAQQLKEYKIAFKTLEVYTSSRATNEWLDR